GCTVAGLSAAGSGYHLVTKVPVPGDSGWDYLAADADSRRLYVSHGTEVNVINMDSLSIDGKIADLSGVHGIAIASGLGRGFISNGKSSVVTIFDLKTLEKLGEVKAG